MRIAIVAGAVAALASAALAAGATPSKGRIVFSATDMPLHGDVMLVRANGTELDLSRSPAFDGAPVVSPNGKLVAFFSLRGGHGAEYVVRTDGTGLHPVTPALSVEPSVAWSPDDRELAVLEGSHVYRASAAGREWVRIDHGSAQGLVGWSPAGTRLAYVTELGEVVVETRTGTTLERLTGDAARWSPTGRLAVERDSRTWQVYDAAGKRVATIAAVEAAWSSGGRLATVTPGGAVQVRAGGVGRPTISARPVRNPSGLLWAGETHLLVDGADGYLSFDTAHHATFLLAAAYRSLPALAPDGTAFGPVGGLTLERSTLSGSTTKLLSVPYCQGKDSAPFAFLQALPDASGAVFAGDCAPPHDLFSVAPDGTGLRRLTTTPQDEIDPAVSPDGARLAFTRIDGADCAGCDHVVWTTNLDGTDARSIPLPAAADGAILEDDRPSFSPDGTTLVFTRWISSVSDQAYLYVAPAAGGRARSLHLFGGDAAWGPARIAFVGSAGDETMAPDGSGVALVPGTAKLDSGIPAWSPDGRLALLEWEKTFAIYLPATRTHIELPGLKAPPPSESWPGLAWSPDGTRLAFTAADGDGAVDVWTIGADGTGLTRVTHGLDAAGALSWR